MIKCVMSLQLVIVFILNTLGYCNSIFTKEAIRHLQLRLNAAAWALTNTKKVDNIAAALRSYMRIYFIKMLFKIIEKL